MDNFEFDVFLSHSSEDKAVVRDVAERLRGDELKVWFDEWVIRPGDSIPLAIERGLESSRTLVLFMSTAAFASEWVTLERHAALFRDPTNQQRRFIPLRLDNCHIKDSLEQFAYVDWRQRDNEQEYAKLLEGCRPDGRPLVPIVGSTTTPTPACPTQETRGLQVCVSPTRNGLRQLAQIRVLNTGRRPILIDSWFVGWSNQRMSENASCERGALPIRLHDHERADLTVDISDEPVERLTSIGVTDAEQRPWPAPEIDVRRFIHTAKLHEPPKIDTQTDTASAPSDVSLEVACADSPLRDSERLEVRFKNLGPHDLAPRSASVEWEYDPPRSMPDEPGQAQVAETGGKISLQLDGAPLVVATGGQAVFFLDSRDSLSQVIVAVLAQDVPDDKLRVNVAASQWQWTASAGEVPGAVREFARAVLHNMK